MKPPGLARILMRLLRGCDSDIVRGDLEELWRAGGARDRSGRAAYVREVAGTVAAWWRPAAIGRRRRLAETHPRLHRPREERRMGDVWRDVRFAFRGITRRPRAAVLVVAILGLGIGATTAVYSVVDGVMVRSLPYPDADRLVAAGVTFPDREWRDDVAGLQHLAGVSYLNFIEVRDRARSLDRLVGFQRLGGLLPDTGNGAELIDMMAVTEGFFETLSTTPLLGRTFLPDDYAGRSGPVVMLTYSTWRDRFGSDPAIVGASSSTLAQTHTIVGVLPPEFEPPEALIGDGVELWQPLDRAHPRYGDRGNRSLTLLGRLADRATLATARAELADLSDALAREFPDGNVYPDGRWFGWGVNPLHAETVGASGRTLLIFLGAAGLLLAIAVLNASNLLFVRGLDRAGEIGVRMALGASRRTVIRHLVVESLALSIISGAVGTAMAWAAVAAFRHAAPDLLPRLDHVVVDGRILLIALGLSALVGVVAGIAPALRAGSSSLAAGMRRSASRIAGPGRRWMDTLVSAQLAIALVLAVGATLLVRSFTELRSVDPGFDPQGLVTFSMGSKVSAERVPHWQIWDALLDEVRKVPGLVAVGASSNIPFESPNWAPWVRRPGAGSADAMTGNAGYIVTPGYLDAMGIPVVRGRGLTAADGPDDVPVMLVNEAFVRTHLGGVDPVGSTLVLGPPDDETRVVVVGVVGDVTQTRAEEGWRPAVYLPYRQSDDWPWSRIVVRSDRDIEALLPELRQAGSRFASFLPVQQLGTFTDRIRNARAEPRIHTLLLLGFAGVAGLLAAAGVYGTLAHSVGQRRREMGIRMAMGADPRQIFSIVLRRSLGVAWVGVGIGLLGAVASAGALDRFLFEVEPLDPSAFAAAAILLGSVTLLAGLVPARRATRVDPTVSLRAE